MTIGPIALGIILTIAACITLSLIIISNGRALGATQAECLKLDATHVKIIMLDSDCYWIVGSLADQGFVVTHVIATDTGDVNQNQVPGIIIMQNQGHLQVSASSIACQLVGKTRECLPT